LEERVLSLPGEGSHSGRTRAAPVTAAFLPYNIAIKRNRIASTRIAEITSTRVAEITSIRIAEITSNRIAEITRTRIAEITSTRIAEITRTRT
jgi:hypothetical protein